MRTLPDPMASAVVIPLVGALLAALLPRSRPRLRWAVAVLAGLGTIWAVSQLVPVVAAGGIMRTGEDLTAVFFGPLYAGRTAHFLEADRFSVYLAVAAVLAAVLVLVASAGVRGEYERCGDLAPCMLVGLAGLDLTLFSAHASLLVGWGLLTICLAAGSSRMTDGKEGADRGSGTLVLLGLGDVCLLIAFGTAMYVRRLGGGDPLQMGTAAFAGSVRAETVFVCGIVVAALTKCAAVLCGSRPMAAERFPGRRRVRALPVTAMSLLFGMLPGAYLLARLTWWVYESYMVPEWLSSVLIVLGLLSMLAAGLMSLLTVDLERFIALQAVCQTGFVLVALSSGSLSGFVGGIVHLVVSVLCLTGLSLIAGNLEKSVPDALLAHTRKMPLTTCAFALCGIGLAGVPLSGGFIGRWAAYRSFVGAGMPLALFVSLFAAVLTMVALGRIALRHTAGGSQAEGAPTEAPPLSAVPPVLLGLMCLVIGVVPVFPAVIAALFGSNYSKVLSMGAVSTRSGILALLALAVSLVVGTTAASMLREHGIDTNADDDRLVGYLRRFASCRPAVAISRVGRVLSVVGLRLHNGSLSRYLAYAFFGLCVLLLLVLT